MTDPGEKPTQGRLHVPSIDPAVSVQAATLARALINAAPFTYTDLEMPPQLRAVRIQLADVHELSVTATDHVTAFYQPIGTDEASVELHCLIEREDAQLIAQTIGGALRSASEADRVTARLRLVELHEETLLRLDVGSRRLDLTTVPSDGRNADVARLIGKYANTGEIAPFAVHLNTKLLKRLSAIKVEFKDQKDIVQLTQMKEGQPIRCEFADEIVVLIMPWNREPSL